jgi:HSP20 family protein
LHSAAITKHKTEKCDAKYNIIQYKGGIDMSGLVPFDRNFFGLRPFGFDDAYDSPDDFFAEPWAALRNNYFKLDVEEKEHEYLVEAELPGVKKEEISIQMYDNRLVITVNKQETADDRNKNYIHKERRYSSMQRTVYLQEASPENITAKLEDGVLDVRVPKEVNTDRSRRIDIQ